MNPPYLPIAKLVGASNILKKPFGIQELRGVVNKILNDYPVGVID